MTVNNIIAGLEAEVSRQFVGLASIDLKYYGSHTKTLEGASLSEVKRRASYWARRLMEEKWGDVGPIKPQAWRQISDSIFTKPMAGEVYRLGLCVIEESI